MTPSNDQTIYETRAAIARTGAMLFERELTDAGGGNISVRVGDRVCITPRYSGQLRRWQLTPEDVLVVDLDGNKYDGDGDLSRESKVHLGLHRAYGSAGTAVIHAHARDIMIFCALARPMPPVLEATLKFGEIPVIDYAPAHSPDLAKNVIGALQGQEARINNHAAAALAPWHGIFLMGKHLDAAFDAVERLNTNARCIFMAQLLGGANMLEKERAALVEAAAKYGKS